MLVALVAGILLLPAQDLTKVLARADELMEEAKKAYEEAKAGNVFEAFVQAAFTVEEARIKYLVVQEVGTDDERKTAAERLRSLQQLSKLINDGRAAVARARAPADAGAPAPPPPAAAPAAPAPRPDVDALRRLPVPDLAAVARAEKTIKDLFKSEFAKKGAPAQKALARTLIEQAAKMSDDAAALYALFRLAGELAAQAVDVEAAVFASDELARLFDIDGLALRTSTLTAVAKGVKTPEQAAPLAEAWIELSYVCAASDQYDVADKAAAAALLQARKTADPERIARATTRAKEVGEAKSKFQSLREHRATLAKTPDHPLANLEMGQFLCFVKAEWDLGVRFLAKGSDAALKAAAEAELSRPPNLEAAADQWMELAAKDKSPLRKGQMTAHARALYQSALPSATGLSKLKIEKRLEELKSAPAAPSPKGGVDLLALIDPAKDKVTGNWQKGVDGVRGGGATIARLQIPYALPEEYDLTVVAERISGSNNIFFALSTPAARWVVIYDAHGNISGLDLVNGKAAWDNPTAVSGKRLKVGSTQTFEFRIRRDGITTAIDGEKVISWKGDYSTLSYSSRFAIPDTKAMAVGMFDGEVRYIQMKLVPVSGEGRKLR